MTWTLQLVRKEVRDQLKAGGLESVGFLPKRFDPPVVLVGAGDPYLSEIAEPTFVETAQQFNAKATVRLELRVIIGTGDDEHMQDKLDEYVCRTLALVANWQIESVSQPFVYQVGTEGLYLAALIVMTAEIDLEEV